MATLEELLKQLDKEYVGWSGFFRDACECLESGESLHPSIFTAAVEQLYKNGGDRGTAVYFFHQALLGEEGPEPVISVLSDFFENGDLSLDEGYGSGYLNEFVTGMTADTVEDLIADNETASSNEECFADGLARIHRAIAARAKKLFELPPLDVEKTNPGPKILSYIKFVINAGRSYKDASVHFGSLIPDMINELAALALHTMKKHFHESMYFDYYVFKPLLGNESIQPLIDVANRALAGEMKKEGNMQHMYVDCFLSCFRALAEWDTEASIIADNLTGEWNDRSWEIFTKSIMKLHNSFPLETERIKLAILLKAIKDKIQSSGPPESASEFIKYLFYQGILEKSEVSDGLLPSLPDKLPETPSDVFDLIARLSSDIEFNPPFTDFPAEVPDEIKKVYSLHDGSNREFFGSFKNGFDKITWFKQYIEDQSSDSTEDILSFEGDLHDVRFHAIEDIFIIGEQGGGDILFIDRSWKNKNGNHPVFIYYHDEMLSVKIAANSIAEFLGKRFLQDWANESGSGKLIEKLTDVPIDPDRV